MKIEWEILTQPEIERINNESLALLEKTGLEVFNPALRKTIAGAGAMVEDTRIRFPGKW